jgi:hypothetical protein
MLKTILIYCLLAFSSAQATVLTFGHAGADHLSLKGAIGAASAGDELLCIASYADTMTVGLKTGTLSSLTIDFGGYTAEFSLATSSDHIFDADELVDFTLENGTVIANSSGLFEVRGSGYQLIQDMNFIVRGGVGAEVFQSTRSDTDSVRFKDCTFARQNAAGTAVRYPGDSRGWFTNAYDIPITFDGCTASGGKFLLYNTPAMTNTLTITDCSFSKFYYNCLDIEDGGVIRITNCTFEKDSTMGDKACKIEPEAAATQDVIVSGCTFNDADLYIGTTTDAAQGGADGASAVITGNTFTGSNISTQCVVRTNYALVHGNTFLGAGGANWGGTVGNPHMLMIGIDGSADVSDTTAAENIRVYDNIFRPTTTLVDGGTTILLNVVKTGTFHIYDNLYDLTGIDLPSTANRAMVFSLRSANDGAIYQNTFIFDDTTWGVLDMSSQVDNTPCDGITFQDNLILGTYGSAVSTTDWNSWGDNQVYDSATIQSNYWGGGTVYRLIGSSGYLNTAVVDAADSTNWFKATNFTTTDTYEYKFGGTGGLTYSAATTEGFIGLGYSPTSTDPVIAANNPGFESPMDALTTCRALGLTSVDLDYLLTRDGAADALNLDIWLNATHPNGSGTWEAQAQDTLKVARVK